jgi:hypothetical protein
VVCVLFATARRMALWGTSKLARYCFSASSIALIAWP